MKKFDLTGLTFGYITVLNESSYRNGHGDKFWDCICQCGKSVVCNSSTLRNGQKYCSITCQLKVEIRLIDLSGSKQGHINIIDLFGYDKHKKAIWNCLCDCGAAIRIGSAALLRQKQGTCSKQCDFYVSNASDKKLKDYSNNIYGRLTAIKRVGSKGNGKSIWLFNCACGQSVEASISDCVSGKIKSCGCLLAETVNYERKRGSTRGKMFEPSYFTEHAVRWAVAIERGIVPTIRDARILDVYRDARNMTKKTGIRYEVDHIIPMNGKFVSGLHVYENLRVITSKENRVKSNKYLNDICCTV